MGNPEPVHYYTIAEYLEMEESADYRSEYFDGEIFAMAGGTEEHNLICYDAARAVDRALEDRNCTFYQGDLMVRIESAEIFYYPDLSIVCGKSIFEDKKKRILTNPMVMFEILSDSTESRDRGKKFERYKQITSFQEYVLVYQTEPKVQVYRKVQEGIWTQYTYSGMDAVMELQSIGIQIKLADIYRRVEFA